MARARRFSPVPDDDGELRWEVHALCQWAAVRAADPPVPGLIIAEMMPGEAAIAARSRIHAALSAAGLLDAGLRHVDYLRRARKSWRR